MADYWVSRKKWTCKYCDITINDDLPSRQQHENGLRHKGNVERALKDLYRKSEHEKRDAEHAKREMVRIERLARQAHDADVTRASGSFSAAVVSSEPKPPSAAPADKTAPKASSPQKEWKPKNKLSAYGSSVADQTRFEEEARQKEVEKAQQDAEAAEEAARRDGVPGEWETATSSVGSTAQQGQQNAEPPSDRDRARSFKLREKQAAYLDDGDEDEDAMEIKVKKRVKVETDTARQMREQEERRRMVPEWRGLALGRGGSEVKAEQDAGDVKQQEDSHDDVEQEQNGGHETQGQSDSDAKQEHDGSDVKPESHSPSLNPTDSVKQEEQESQPETKPNPSGGGMFRKRKAGAGSGAKKVRMF